MHFLGIAPFTNYYQITLNPSAIGLTHEESFHDVCVAIDCWDITVARLLCVPLLSVATVDFFMCYNFLSFLVPNRGFSVHTGDRHQVFKPSSVQSMW